jgi:putative phosphoribosyl transferase
MRVSTTKGDRPVKVPVGHDCLEGILAVPAAATGMVLFAHGSGSGRLSPRNQFVARSLSEAGLGTLLIDLLTEEEAEDREKVFDIDLLAGRLQLAADWLQKEPRTASLRLGLFGASTGAAAALIAAVRQPETIAAVVSRGGRPDLVMDELTEVQAPTLLIVGGHDDVVLELNREALSFLRCSKKLEVIPHATHLFAEPGALEAVSRLATEWFRQYLTPADTVEPKLRASDVEPMC